METQALESYLGQMRDLISQRKENSLEDDSAIFHLIDEFKAARASNHSDEAFFEGERNFYAGNLETSLKFYLEAKEFPHFQFFCYRASSLISQKRGEQEKALNYAQKAFKIDPHDPSLRSLYASLSGIEVTQESVTHPVERAESNFSLLTSSHQQEVKEIVSNTSLMLLEEKNELQKRIHLFQSTQTEKMQAYLLKERKSRLGKNFLCVLNGWSFHSIEKALLFTEDSRKSHGGHYFRWNDKGIVINPGPGFMEYFHDHELTIRDIDFVIVTRNSREVYADVRTISELNQQLNKISPERQIIHYYLHQKVYQQLAPFLKPSFKQARNTIHKFEMFLDSPDVEKIELDEGIVLHYFLNSMPDSSHDQEDLNSSNLGIRFELTNERKKIKIGYLSGLAWSPLLIHHLGYCDLLLVGFGNTSSTDYSKLGYNEDSLGYFGLVTLLEQLTPRLMLISEFGGREGDIRLEVIKKMRTEPIQNSSPQKSILLPVDIGFELDLDTLQVKCLLSDVLVDPQNIHVVSTSDSFGRLRYLSPHYCG